MLPKISPSQWLTILARHRNFLMENFGLRTSQECCQSIFKFQGNIGHLDTYVSSLSPLADWNHSPIALPVFSASPSPSLSKFFLITKSEYVYSHLGSLDIYFLDLLCAFAVVISKHAQSRGSMVYFCVSADPCSLSSSWEGHALSLVPGSGWETPGTQWSHPSLPVWGLSRSLIATYSPERWASSAKISWAWLKSAQCCRPPEINICLLLHANTQQQLLVT